jgi:hypothetical protein
LKVAFHSDNRGAHQRGGQQAESLTTEPTGEVPFSGARRRDKTERSERRDTGGSPGTNYYPDNPFFQ